MILRALSFLKKSLRIRWDAEMFFGRGHFSWHRRPTSAKALDRSWVLGPNSEHPEVAIVMQGPLDRQKDFTMNTLEIYRHLFPRAVLILSTWTSEKSKHLEKIADLGVHIILTEPLEGSQTTNLMRQIATTQAGIRHAKKLGVQFVLKVRTDQRFYSPEALKYFHDVLNQFPIETTSRAKGRVLFASRNSFVERPLSASDFLQFGHVEDIEALWNAPLDYQFEGELVPEQLILGAYLRSLGWKDQDLFSHEVWMRTMRDLLVFIDTEPLDFIWHKYSQREYMWRRYGDSERREVTFAFWLSLQGREGAV